MRTLGYPGFFKEPGAEDADQDKVLGELEEAVKDGRVVCSFWFDNSDNDRYAYAPQKHSGWNRHLNILSAFPVYQEDCGWARPLPFNVDTPPAPDVVMTGSSGVKAVSKDWGKLCLVGKGHGQSSVSCWSNWVNWSRLDGMRIKSGSDWQITVPVLPSSACDRHLSVSPSTLWQPLDVCEDPTNSPAGRRKGLEWMSEYAVLCHPAGVCCVVVLDYDTWYSLFCARYDETNYGLGLMSVVNLLDCFHCLKDATFHFINYISFLLPNLADALFDKGNAHQPALGFYSLKQMQWLLSVLALSYMNSSVDFSNTTLEDVGGDKLLFDFVLYLSSIFDVVLPLLWGAWWTYREGKPVEFWRLLCALLPFLQYNNAFNYVFAIAVSCGQVLGNEGGVKDWLVAGHFRLSSAETGELAFNFLSRRLYKHTAPDLKAIKKELFGLGPHWDADRRWKSLLGVAKRKPYRARVAHDSVWVQRTVDWLERLSEGLVDKGQLPDIPLPRRGGCLQVELPGLVVRQVNNRMKTVIRESKGVVDKNDGVPSLSSLRTRREHLNWSEDLLSGRTAWQQWLVNKFGSSVDTSNFVKRPPIAKKREVRLPTTFVTVDEWELNESARELARESERKKRGRKRAGSVDSVGSVESVSKQSRFDPGVGMQLDDEDSDSDDNTVLRLVGQRLQKEKAAGGQSKQ